MVSCDRRYRLLVFCAFARDVHLLVCYSLVSLRCVDSNMLGTVDLLGAV